MTCFTQTCQLCVPTTVEMSFMKNIFWCGCCSLLIFVAKKFGKSTELQFLCTQGTLQGGRVEDHRLMFNRHLHSPQLYIQAILYIYKSDYMMSLTLFTLKSVCIFSILFPIHVLMCWEGELFNNQEVLQLIIISFILMTLMLDWGMILKGEIRYWSLSGIKVLITVHILCAPCICWQQSLRLLGKQTDEQKTMKWGKL